MHTHSTTHSIEVHERRARLGAALADAIDIFTIHSEEAFDDVLNNALYPIADAVGVQRITFYRHTEIEHEYRLKQIFCWNRAEGGLTKKTVYVLPETQFVTKGLAAVQQDVCLAKRLDNLSELEGAFLKAYGIKSLLAVPIFTHGEFWGVVFFEDTEHFRDFDEDCIDIYRSIARLCVSSIIRAEMTRKADEAIEAFKNRERMMEMLIKTSVVFLSRSEDLTDDVMSLGVGLISNMVNVDKISVWRNSETPEGLRTSQIYHWDRGLGTVRPFSELKNIPYSQFCLPLEKIFAEGDSAMCHASMLPDEAVFHRYGIQSAFITPVYVGSSLWGFVLFADTHSEHHFDNNGTDIMRSGAFLIANTVIRTEMEKEISDKNELNQVMFDSAPIGLTICDESFNFVDCNQAALDMLGVTKKFYIDNFYTLSPEYQPDGSKSKDKSLDNFARALGGTRLVTEWMHCSLTGEPIPTELTLTRAMYKGKYITLGYIYDLRNVKHMEADIQRLESVVDYDALTGIYNRRYFDKNIERLIKSLSRSKGQLSLLMIDIDHFKKYNDTYGHIAGDQCLNTIAEVLANSVLREGDFVARYGGEEFVVVLPNTDTAGARRVSEIMHENIRRRKIPHAKNGNEKYVTISIGGTTGMVNHKQSREDYVKQADEMLYASKQAGRNRSAFGALDGNS